MFGFTSHPSVSDSSHLTTVNWTSLLQGKEELQHSKSSCVDGSGYNIYLHKEAITFSTDNTYETSTIHPLLHSLL